MRKLIAALFALSSIFLFSCSRDDEITVGSIIFNGSGEWFEEALQGVRDSARDQKVRLIESDSHYDLKVEGELIREQLNKHCDAIVICPITTEESGAALAGATSVGIPVVTWNTVVQPLPTTQVIVDSTKLGSATGDYIREYVNKNGIKKLKTALITNDFYSIGIERCRGFEDAIQPLVDEKIVEIAEELRLEHSEETKIAVRKLLENTPDIDFIWCWHQTSLLAVSEVLKEMKRGDILLAGTDMSMGIARDMLGDEIKLIAVTTQQPYRMGYEAVSTAVRAVKEGAGKVEQTVVIPTLTYTVDDPDGLREYVKNHAKFESK